MSKEIGITLGTTKITGVRTGSHSGVSVRVPLVVGTRYYECIDGTKWPSFYIKEGAVTGYESFHITEESLRDLSHGWCACSGTYKSWDKLEISGYQMTKAFKSLGLIKAVEDKK